MSEKVAIFPGSFDPFTIGHLSVVERASGLFDSIVIAIGINDKKTSQNTVAERMEQIRGAVSHIGNVRVTSYSGLTVDICREYGAKYILRGVRSVTDFEYEQHIADINRRISGIETVILFTLPEHSSVSSSIVRELQKYGYDTKEFLP